MGSTISHLKFITTDSNHFYYINPCFEFTTLEMKFFGLILTLTRCIFCSSKETEKKLFTTPSSSPRLYEETKYVSFDHLNHQFHIRKLNNGSNGVFNNFQPQGNFKI